MVRDNTSLTVVIKVILIINVLMDKYLCATYNKMVTILVERID